MLQFLVSTEATFCKSEDDLRPCSPPKLTKTAGKIVNSMELPNCWEWTVQNVSEWLENDVKLPQYKDCLTLNLINGRRLCLLEAHKLLKMGVHDLVHIQKITEAIRKLFKIEKEHFGRSISLPLRYPMTLYLEYKVPTGPIRENTTKVDFFTKISILENRKKSKFDTGEFPVVKFGGVKRKSVYNRLEYDKKSPHVHKKFINFLFH